MKLRKIWRRSASGFARRAIARFFASARACGAAQIFAAAFFAAMLAAGCSRETETRVTLWTNSADLVPYIELFNATHESQKVLLVYKENPAQSLALDEEPPDIAVGSWLCTDDMARRFQSVDGLFASGALPGGIFYAPLLEAGKVGNTQYLVPVSFNLPAVIFSKENAQLVENGYVLSIDEIRLAGQAFNETRGDGVFTRIGFAPQADGDFLYFVARAKGADFRAANGGFVWNGGALSDALDYLRSWTNEANGSAETERDFIYKYLSVPSQRQINSGRTLFAYTTSGELLRLASEQAELLDFRWISENGKIPVDDSLVMLGIPRRAKNKKAAQVFVEWFFNAETQREIFEYKRAQGLDAGAGIAGGFSSIREVNEHILPAYKTMLLSNAPPAETLEAPQKLPARWAAMKAQVVIPYLQDAVAENAGATLEERIDEWTRQNYE